MSKLSFEDELRQMEHERAGVDRRRAPKNRASAPAPAEPASAEYISLRAVRGRLITMFVAGVMSCALIFAVSHIIDQETLNVHFIVDDVTGIDINDAVYFKGKPIGSVDSTEVLDVKRVALVVSIRRSDVRDASGKLLLFQDTRLTLSKSEKPDHRMIVIEPGELNGYPILDGQAIATFAGSKGVPRAGKPKGLLDKTGDLAGRLWNSL